MSAVSFGKRERYRFEGLGALISWAPPTMAAIYAVTYIRVPERPTFQTVVFFGQTNNLLQQGEMITRKITDWWKSEGGEPGDLLVSAHYMPGSSVHDRARVRERLLAEYLPWGNRSD